MADKSIEELREAELVRLTDLFLLQQSGEAKKITGQTLIRDLAAMLDGHGGIAEVRKSTSGLTDSYTIVFTDQSTYVLTLQNAKSITSIAKTSTSGLTDTYRITYNDGTTSSYQIKNGRGISSFAKTSTSGLTDTYTLTYNDGSQPSTLTIKNGERGLQGLQGPQGAQGVAATLIDSSIEFAVSESGQEPPTTWSTAIPIIPQGRYMWTRFTLNFNTGAPVVGYAVSRSGSDGSGSVVSVNEVSPVDGNVTIGAENILTTGGDTVEDALKNAGGVNTVCGVAPDENKNVALRAANINTASGNSVETELGGKQPIVKVSGLLKGDGTGKVTASTAGVDYQPPASAVAVQLTAADWNNKTQSVAVVGVTGSNSVIVSPTPDSFTAYGDAGCHCISQASNQLIFACDDLPSADLSVNVLVL